MNFYSKRIGESHPHSLTGISLGEILPRLALLEDLVRNLRVLEVGVRDVRSLLQLEEFGAEQIIGTYVAPVEMHDSIESQAIELVAMDRGVLEFASASFDCIVVNDCDKELAANAAFLDELRRVLAPDGICTLAFDVPSQTVDSSGRSTLAFRHCADRAPADS